MDVIAEWNQQYGDVCGYFCGTWPALATTDPVFIQNVFITNFRQFPDRCTMALANTQATGLPPGIFEYSGLDQWKRVRHITLPAFTKAKLAMMSHHLEKSCAVMVDKMMEESTSHHSIHVLRLYRKCTLESSVLAVLGQEVGLQKGEAGDFKSWIELGTKIAHGKHPLSQLYMFLPVDLFIGHQFPWFVKFYYWLGAGRLMPAFRKLKVVITHCIQERRQKAREQQLQESCVLDLLVAASESAGDGQLTDDDIISNCLNFLFAAYDTTSLTLTCASHLLATNPHVQDKLCGLLDDYWDQNKGASVSTVAQEVPYLDMILDETMRLFPPSPRMARICRESTEVCGIQIPKDMNIIVPVHYLHRMESIWGDPLIFRPERFEREESATRPTCCYLPMGLGPRNCVGLKLAKLLMKVALVSILKRHHFVRTQKTADVLGTECYCFNLTLTTTVFVDLEKR
jgi:cytochrome P450 family 3 subfamily A